MGVVILILLVGGIALIAVFANLRADSINSTAAKNYDVSFNLLQSDNTPVVNREEKTNGIKISISHPDSLSFDKFKELMTMISMEEADWYFQACDYDGIRFNKKYAVIMDKISGNFDGRRDPNFHRNQSHRNRCIQWAKDVLREKDKYVILDTETTGVNRNAVIVQIGIIDMDGNVLLDSLVKPTKRKRIAREATAIHGISMKDLENQPTFPELLPKIKSILDGKVAIIYNEEYDRRLVEQTCDQDECGYFRFASTCAMERYSMFVGEWDDRKYDYRWQKLPSADHSAVGDCLATLQVIKKMAEWQPVNQ